MEPPDPFALVLDVSQGFSCQAVGNHLTPYLFSAKLSPEFKFGDFGLGALLNTRYSNPQWDFGTGFRLEYLFLKIAPDTGLRLVVDGTPWLTVSNFTWEGGVVGDFSGLARLGVWYGFDTQSSSSSFMASVGVNIISIIKVLHPKVPEPDFGNK